MLNFYAVGTLPSEIKMQIFNGPTNYTNIKPKDYTLFAVQIYDILYLSIQYYNISL